MVIKRIGQDLTFVWAISRKDGSMFFLEDKQIRLFMSSPRGRIEFKNYSVKGNVIEWKFLGKNQFSTGDYTATIQIENGNSGAAIIDQCNCLRLVPRTCTETAGCEGIVNGDTISFGSRLNAFQIMPIVPTADQEGNIYADGKLITDAIPVTLAKVNAFHDNASKAESARVLAENNRSTAETNRQNAETGRVDAENLRISAESQRNSAEDTRKQNELLRQKDEDNRRIADNARDIRENDRIANETKRQTSENFRISEERKRSDDEAQRINNETQRINDENTRKQGEISRQENENRRNAAESVRTQSEDSRNLSEANRQLAEEKRQTDTSRAIQNANNATALANNAAAKADTSANNADAAAELAARNIVAIDYDQVTGKLRASHGQPGAFQKGEITPEGKLTLTFNY